KSRHSRDDVGQGLEKDLSLHHAPTNTPATRKPTRPPRPPGDPPNRLRRLALLGHRPLAIGTGLPDRRRTPAEVGAAAERPVERGPTLVVGELLLDPVEAPQPDRKSTRLNS